MAVGANVKVNIRLKGVQESYLAPELRKLGTTSSVADNYRVQMNPGCNVK